MQSAAFLHNPLIILVLLNLQQIFSFLCVPCDNCQLIESYHVACLEFMAHPSSLTCVVAHPDNNLVLTTGEDGTAQLVSTNAKKVCGGGMV